MNIKTSLDTISTIFAVDLSESTRNNRDDVRGFIEEALKHAEERDKVGIITFGQDGEIEIPLTDNLESFDFQTNPGEEFTNIQKGLAISQALIPENTNKRIVLITDGEENLGNSIAEGSLLQLKDIDFKVYNIDKTETAEVQLQNIEIPKVLHENQSFDVVLKIFSNVKTKAKITLYSDRTIVGESDVVIEKGSNRFVFKDEVERSGFKSYKAVITPERDSFTENNTYSTYTEIKGKPNILLVDGESNGAREMEKILSSTGINVTRLKDRELPRTLSELTKYNSIILCDVSLENVNNGFINSIKSYVRDYGGGLVATGGEDSFALGGYYKTPLEEVLPVDMEMKIKGEVPSLGLMLVIDKSGSMGGEGAYSKIELAKEAAIRALDSLKVKDKIGVIAFDGAAQWVVEMSGIQDKDDIKSSIGTIRAGGGTSIIPALDEGYRALKDVDTKLKHIILLTDGQAERSGYDELVDNIREAGITISTVAIGEGADQYLLESIATNGKGRYYFVDEASAIPQIFTKETFLASKSYINNRTFTPTARYFHEIINPLFNGTPDLNGYVSTSKKARAETILTSDKDEPILAVWQYGLGRSVAWTSDVNGKWSSDYLTSEEGIDFIKNMIEWTLPRVSSSNLVVESIREGDIQEITVTSSEEFDKEYVTKATVISPSNIKEEVELSPERPGEYKVKIPVTEKGVYIVKVNQYKDDTIVNTANHGIAVNYSKEYDFSASVNRLSTLVNKGNGKFINSPEEVFNGDFRDVYGMKDLSRGLIILALLLFILDIAYRRLNIRFNKLQLIGERINSVFKNLGKRVYKTKDNIKEEKTTNKHMDTSISMNEEVNDKKGKKTQASFNAKKNKKKNDSISREDRNTSKDNKNSVNQNLNTSRLLKAKDKKRR